MRQRLIGALGSVLGFMVYCLRRYGADGCPRVAASLSYASLLASIPLLAIAFGVLSHLPLFDEIYIEILDSIFANFLPEAGLEISEQVVIFLENAQELTGVGFIALFVAAFLLLSSITASFNAIWRVAVPRPLWGRFLIQWAILALWPLLILCSVLLSSLWGTVIAWFGLTEMAQSFGFSRVLPFIVTLVAFASLYLLLPSRAVQWRHAVTGALAATLLFELLKRGFGYYADTMADYEVIYGALAALPLALVWMYLSWTAILIGAEITAALPEWRIRRQFGKAQMGPSARLALALTLLERLRAAREAGRRGLNDHALIARLPCDPGVFHDVMHLLSRAGLVRRGFWGWRLHRGLDSLNLGDLMTTLGVDWTWDASWPDTVREIVGTAILPQSSVTGASLESLLTKPKGGG